MKSFCWVCHDYHVITHISPRAQTLLFTRLWAKGLRMGYRVKVPAESKSGSLTAGSSTVFSEFTGYHGNQVENTDADFLPIIGYSSASNKDREL